MPLFKQGCRQLRTKAYIVVTNCTKRKRGGGGSEGATNLPPCGSCCSEAAAHWLRRVQEVEPQFRAEELYSGRAFAEARSAARRLKAAFYVASAGLGLVHGNAYIPAYDLTVSGEGDSSIGQMLASWNASPSDWWMALATSKGEGPPLASLIERKPHTLFLIALPSAYVRLLSTDLESVGPHDRERIRLFTSPQGANLVPSSLKDQVMPYDERLEATPWAGTRADFPQRAMRHFVDQGAIALPTSAAASRVREAMQGLTRVVIPTRRRKTDAELRELLSQHWDRFGGSSSKLLRFLRDEALVACEQSRFRGLWRAMRSSEAARLKQ